MLRKSVTLVLLTGALFCLSLTAGKGADLKNLTDKQFVEKAAQCNMMETALGKLAEERSGNADVKGFADKLVKDHSRAIQQLQTAAQAVSTLPQNPSKQCKECTDKLSQLKGAEFDRAYMQEMVKSHQKGIQLFEAEARGGTDPQVKAYAAKVLPELRQHLELAKAISAKVSQ